VNGVETKSDVSLSLCPSDVVCRVGETVVLRAAQPDSKVMRWSRQLATDRRTVTQTTIYTGLEVDYKQVDHRYCCEEFCGLSTLIESVIFDQHTVACAQFEK